jgi:hypothetical protein
VKDALNLVISNPLPEITTGYVQRKGKKKRRERKMIIEQNYLV